MIPFPVQTLLAPESVAVVGASPREETIGFRVIRNLRRLGFPGPIHPVNPRYAEVAGLRCYPSLSALPERVDAAFVAVPAARGPAILAEAGACRIRAVVINASGYADGGPEGKALQDELERTARAHRIAVCGPNNMGFINVHRRTALWTAGRFPELRPGPVAVISQSGSVALTLSQDERKLGLAWVITTGNEAVLSAADYLSHVVRDDRVRLVLLFLEAIRAPALFAEAATEAAARGKRLLAVKVGKSEGGRAAVTAHTGALAGEDEVYDAFFRRHGVARFKDLDEMTEAAVLFSAYPASPPTPHVAAATFSGGEAALIADLGAETGISFPAFAPGTVERLRPAFPPAATLRNPLDAWGLGWDLGRFTLVLEGLLADRAIGTIAFAVDAPASGGGDGPIVAQMARVSVEALRATDKRLVFFNNTTGGGLNPEVAEILAKGGIPYLAGMREALAAIAGWVRGGEREGAPVMPRGVPGERARERARDWRRLTEVERFRLLGEAGVPMVECRAVTSPEDAVLAAEQLGYPVVLKATSADAPHKTELGLVRLGLETAAAVREAFGELAGRTGHGVSLLVQRMAGPGVELIAGVRNDPAFGSLVVVGLGGIHVEVLREVSVRLGPVDRETAAAMLRETRAGALLRGARGKGPYDLDAAADAIAALSEFGAGAHGVLAAVEINPLIVLEQGKGAVGVDALLEPVSER